MNSKKIFIAVSIVLLALLAAPAALAQEETPPLELRLNRDFGYGGFGNDIQGTFTIKVNGPENLEEVHFYLDDTLMGTDSEPPYALQFNTDNFESGIHTISAVGVLADGSEITSNEVTPDFLSSDDAMGKTLNIVGPILAVAAIAVLLGAVVPALLGKKGKTRPIGEYSVAGGTICPRCEFPYSRNTFSPNLVFGKLERCPHCGKWSLRPRASSAELAAAEERLRAAQDETAQVEFDPQESIQRALDESRYDD